MKKLLSKLTSLSKRTYIIIAVILIIGLIIIITRTKNDTPVDTAEKIKQIEAVVINGNAENMSDITFTGTLQALESVNLSTETSGKIKSISKKEGAVVKRGDVILTLENTEENLNYQKAKNNLENQRIILANLENQYNQDSTSIQSSIVTQQDAVIENARIARNSTGLSAIAQSRNNSLAPPVITGTYTGLEGQYKIRVERKNVQDIYYLEVFGLERLQTERLLDNKSIALGEGGLFIQFSGNLADYYDTQWLIDIPNLRSPQYAALSGAYTLAKNAKNVALKQSEVTDNDLAQQKNNVRQFEIALEEARLRLEKTIVRAPFFGELVSLNVKTGERVNATATVGVVKNLNQLEIEFFISPQEQSVVQKGSKVILNETVIGEVYFVGSTFSDNNLKIKARAILDAENKDVKSLVEGSSVTFTVSTLQNSASSEVVHNNIIPLTALQIIGNDTYIASITSHNLIEMKPVQTGILFGNTIEILEGIDSVSSIALDARGLRNGDQVEIKQQ